PRGLRHDVADRAQAVELGHLEVHRDDVGVELMDLADRVEAVARRRHHAELPGPGDALSPPPHAGGPPTDRPRSPPHRKPGRRGSAPRAVSCSTRRGTAVSGNLARLVASRARLFDGRRIWAMAPAPAFESWSMIATHDPSPSVTMTTSPRSAAQSATLTTRSLGAGGSFAFLVTRRSDGRSARAAPPARVARAPVRTASRPCPAAACRRARAPRRKARRGA